MSLARWIVTRIFADTAADIYVDGFANGISHAAIQLGYDVEIKDGRRIISKREDPSTPSLWSGHA